MRMKQNQTETVYIAEKRSEKNAIGEVMEAWGEKQSLRADIKPLSDRLSAEMYGERVRDMRRIISKSAFQAGMGVWFTPDTEDPQWVIVAAANWPQFYVGEMERRVKNGGD